MNGFELHTRKTFGFSTNKKFTFECEQFKETFMLVVG